MEKRLALVLGALVLVGGAWAVANFTGRGDEAPAQPGAAPPGKVWSAEHGHWHDAPGALGTQPLGQPSTTGQTMTPPPPGEAPPGKVWSAEHGHWHDAPGGSTADSSRG